MKILLNAWAKIHYAPPPSAFVLRQWVRKGEIVPAPELVGRAYYVDDTARRIVAGRPARPSLVERLKARP
ncbi:excisionase [Rubrivivax gelatinosus]|uniref:excisionase n=1 Tax=Rubrivivax gelatinosus TaxID=28068 RepID=UPI00031F0F31|nr:excisionase [Rubrivivax gelatinosus]MBG6082704.1 putative site-specific integrase-resolvase [Rubrivivax gelatinosus]